MGFKHGKTLGMILLLFGVVVTMDSFNIINLSSLSIVGAYDPATWVDEIKFDPIYATDECKGTNPEFQLITETLEVNNMARITLSETNGKTVCGFDQSSVYWDYETDEIVLKDILFIDTNSVEYEISDANNLVSFEPYQTMSILAIESKNGILPWYIVVGTSNFMYEEGHVCIRLEDEPTKCVMQTPVTCRAGVDCNLHFFSYQNCFEYDECGDIETGCCGTVVYNDLDLIFRLETPFVRDVIVDYTVPMETIPDYLHYRQYTCPLPDNYMMVTESFGAGVSVNKYAFRYPVNFFCEQHPVIVTDSVTSQSYVDTQLYKDLVAGESFVVPSGKTYTFFYVISANADLPVICETGVYDADENLCVVEPGIIHVCSVGQFDPVTGLCVVQPDSVYLCPEGGRYDVALDVCIYNPPLQAVCPEGSIYNVDMNKCIYSPETQAICDYGTLNPVTGYCEYLAPGVEVCEVNYDYNPVTMKCEYLPETLIICDEGFVFNSLTDKCESYPTKTIVCPGDYIYNEGTDTCIKYVSSVLLCDDEGAVYDEAMGVCVINPPDKIVCEHGTFNEDLNVCIYTPDYTVACPGESVYDIYTQTCVYSPPESYYCDLGYNYNPVSGYCEYVPSNQPICIYGNYDSSIGTCVWYPNMAYICATGVYDSSTQTCSVSPELTITCLKGEYDSNSETCVYNPEVVEPGQSKNLFESLAGVIMVISGVILMYGV